MGTQCSTVHCTATSFLVKFKPFIHLPTKISHRDDQKRRGGPQNGLIMISKTEKVVVFVLCMCHKSILCHLPLRKTDYVLW